jgi:hypothetical protein
VLLIQMQDADINATNNNTYGSGVAGNNGSGSSALNAAGQYQFVRATNTVGAGGGTLNFTPALAFNLRSRTFGVSGATGTSRWQAIRVPPCATASVSGVTAPSWNGTTGGVVVLDVLGALTLNGTTAIDVKGLGFRGGGGRGLTGNAGVGATNTDYISLASANANGSKAEGIAGTPRFTNDATYNVAPVVTDNNATYGEGYQSGSYARGAPGNAGGGGTDGSAASINDQNAGGGGGSNYGVGAVGGNSWNSNLAIGGRGGFGYSASLRFTRVFMGGGGGAGTTNNSTADNAAVRQVFVPAVRAVVALSLCEQGAFRVQVSSTHAGPTLITC